MKYFTLDWWIGECNDENIAKNYWKRIDRISNNLDKGFTGLLGYGDLGYDEFDINDNNEIEHRILFSSGIEFNITFKDFDYIKI